MAYLPVSLKVQWVRNETPQTRLISLDGSTVWSFVPGHVASLGIEGLGESYFAIASAPDDRGGMEFLVKKGGDVANYLFDIKQGSTVLVKGPLGKGFPIEQYKGRDFLIACVGTAIAPMRSIIRSISYRRNDFGKITVIYGSRFPEDFSFAGEIKDWEKMNVQVIMTVSRPEGKDWKGKTGHVQSYFADALEKLSQPIVPICGMKAMMEESKRELTRLGVPANEILTNY